MAATLYLILFGGYSWWLVLDSMTIRYRHPPDIIKYRKRRNSAADDSYHNVEPLLDIISGSLRKYSRATVSCALDAVLNQNVTITQASLNFGIKRTSLQHYLKKLRIKTRMTDDDYGYQWTSLLTLTQFLIFIPLYYFYCPIWIQFLLVQFLILFFLLILFFPWFNFSPW